MRYGGAERSQPVGPIAMPTSCPQQIEAAIVAAKREKPHWGARKIRERLLDDCLGSEGSGVQHYPRDPGSPWHGRPRPSDRSTRAEGTALSAGLHPNDLWCTDYKGEFQLGNKRYCYPLTVTDYASRYLAVVRGHGVQCRAARFYGV